MDEPFEIPVIYKGKEVNFPAQLIQQGYLHKFKVIVDDYEVMYEPDEERNYRAVVDPAHLQSGKKIDVELLMAIAVTLQEIIQ